MAVALAPKAATSAAVVIQTVCGTRKLSSDPGSRQICLSACVERTLQAPGGKKVFDRWQDRIVIHYGTVAVDVTLGNRVGGGMEVCADT